MARPVTLTYEQRKERIAERARRWRSNNLSKSKDYWKKWAKNHPIKAMLVKVASRAKRNGVPFTLKPEDVVLPEFCPVLGIKLEYNGRPQSDAYPNWDRVRPEKGYVPGNVRIISYRANRIKQDGTAKEHLKIAQYITESLKEEKV